MFRRSKRLAFVFRPFALETTPRSVLSSLTHTTRTAVQQQLVYSGNINILWETLRTPVWHYLLGTCAGTSAAVLISIVRGS